jgi:flagellin
MTRINTNVNSLVAQNRLNRTNNDLQTSLTRLSTGLRINTGKDDPAGLIASEALRSDITSINKAISNTQRAGQIIATADTALGQVSNLLNDIRGLVTEAANNGALSQDEIAANQLQVDSSLEAINRIAQTTTFQGRRLLDGSLDFVSTIGSVSTVRDSKIDQANLGATGSVQVDVNISSAATQAALTVDGSNAFTAATTASATSDIAKKSYTLSLGGVDMEIVGGSDFTQIEVVQDDALNAAATASFAGGKLTITFDGNSNATTLAALKTTINAGGSGIAANTPTGAHTLATGDAFAATSTTDSTVGIQVDAPAAGGDYNNVQVKYEIGAATAAAYDSDSSTLTVTVATGGDTLTNIKTAIDSTGFTATLVDSTGTAASFGTAELDLANESVATANTGTSGGETLKDALVFELNGLGGSEVFNFQTGATAKQIAAAVNLVSDATGVSATRTGSDLSFDSTAYGSDALVAINIINEGSAGGFKNSLSAMRSNGTDIAATINGVTASGKGNTLSINTSTLDLSLTVDDGSSDNFSFSISGGGALFQLGGDVVSNQQARLGIGSVSTGQLGGASGRLYELGSGQGKALTSDITGAAEVIDEVIGKVATLRGRLGAFQRTTLESNSTSLTDTVANLTEAESSIRDADFAKESARLTRNQILVQSGTSVLAIANQNPQQVLSLLR